MTSARTTDRTPGREPRVSRRRVSAAIFTILGAGCLGAPRPRDAGETATPTVDGAQSTSSTPTATPTTEAATPDETLDATLRAVAGASNPAAVAESRGLQTRDGRVLVVVTLRPGHDLPADFDLVVTARRDEAVFAYVAYDDLRPVAAHRNVSAVRPPNTVS